MQFVTIEHEKILVILLLASSLEISSRSKIDLSFLTVCCLGPLTLLTLDHSLYLSIHDTKVLNSLA